MNVRFFLRFYTNKGRRNVTNGVGNRSLDFGYGIPLSGYPLAHGIKIGMHCSADGPQCNTRIGFEFLGKSEPSSFVAIQRCLMFHNCRNEFNGTKINKRESYYNIESRRRLHIKGLSNKFSQALIFA